MALILFSGFLLRIVPILWGVPVNSFIRDYHPDEGKVLSSIIEFPEIYWTTKPFPGYGTSVQYLIGILLTPIKFVFLKLSGGIRANYFIFVKVFSRFVSVTLGTLSVYLTYLISLKLFNKTSAIISALFLSTSFYHVLNSSIITLDVSSSFLLTLNFLLSFKAIESKKRIDSMILGIFTGVMIGSKLILGLFVVIPIVIVAFNRYAPVSMQGDGNGQALWSKQAKNYLVFIATCLLVFVAFHPHIFLDVNKYVAFYLREKHDWIDRTKGTFTELLYKWPASTFESTGVFYGILGFLGLVFSGRKELVYKFSIGMFVLLYYCFWGWFLLPRYVITISPFICMFAANSCALLMDRDGKHCRVLGISIVVVATITSTAVCLAGISDRLKDTRPAVSKYMHDTIPPGATIGVCSISEKYQWTTHPWRYPKMDFNRFRIVNFLAEPEYIVMNATDAERVTNTLNSGKLNENYVLPEIYNREWYRYSAPSPRIFRFYDDLLVKQRSRYKLIMLFPRRVTVPLEFPSPEIRIYKRGDM